MSPDTPSPNYDDEFNGVGGAYIVGPDGKRMREPADTEPVTKAPAKKPKE